MGSLRNAISHYLTLRTGPHLNRWVGDRFHSGNVLWGRDRNAVTRWCPLLLIWSSERKGWKREVQRYYCILRGRKIRASVNTGSFSFESYSSKLQYVHGTIIKRNSHSSLVVILQQRDILYDRGKYWTEKRRSWALRRAMNNPSLLLWSTGRLLWSSGSVFPSLKYNDQFGVKQRTS